MGQTFFSFDISWVDPVLNKYFLADRSNKSIDILDRGAFPGASQQFVKTRFRASLATTTPPVPTAC